MRISPARAALLLGFALQPLLGHATPRPLAVLGDSDSAGYQDSISFPPGSPERGGAHRAQSFQWTEVLATLRSAQLDLGPREETGVAGWRARLTGLVGETPRAPRKFDHRHNFAISGAVCENLTGGNSPQLHALTRLIAEQPAQWRRGAVVIRIGINDLGDGDRLAAIATDPNHADFVHARTHCLEQIQQAALQLRAQQPHLLIVLVGLFNNAHWAPYVPRFQQAEQLANIDRAIDGFDSALRALAHGDSGMLFFDDRAWFADTFGGRADDGSAAYRSLAIGDLTVHYTQGDAPEHAILADGHIGTVWNALWANHLLELLNAAWHRRGDPEPAIPPISQDEILGLLGRQ
ncbi:SGNH/GDSL hydrolase family protein [Pseudomarimonas arenosa]|uniref:SGNH/GDSL hydrolase family protein n=1 Tax=Pseudomarimonas arenosa TaxID=2774145 RepID=A0AAW3ZQT1_9GAMM|nr:SGNH/GDSL hydrolase family protein [Pseudomarimonas arenosa]MBD8526646.1 SGNH/GDSL hydrolase family protein [Pseudomarimonas arenosa]